MSAQQVCPVVGTTNATLPPSHPKVDLSQPGQTCPVVGASTDHHHDLHTHPSVPIPAGASPSDAAQCPALKAILNDKKSQEMDDQVCPVVGTATSVLPPYHPSVGHKGDDVECPVTKAKVGHHKSKVMAHPDVVQNKGKTCPVVGATA